MIGQYVAVNRVLRSIAFRAWDGISPDLETSDRSYGVILTYLSRDIRELKRLWPAHLSERPLLALKADVEKGGKDDLRNLLDVGLPKAEDSIDRHFSEQPVGDLSSSIVELLHPAVIEASHSQFRNQHYREAVFNAVVSVFELIRRRSGLSDDGHVLAATAFSPKDPILTVADLKTKTGRSEQEGYMQMLRGFYLAVRNPKAHSLETDLDQIRAAQFLVFASLLARKVEGATRTSADACEPDKGPA